MLAPPRDIVDALLPWFRECARDLPWRRSPTPYRVLLSELMLQQTRVDTVVPYFERFLERWPTLEALAAADLEDVLHAWAGLGYYSRARNLHKCAIAASRRGGLPSTVEGLRELPGVGPYTAGAIASIAFGARAALVDGNVERVLCRLDADPTPPRSTTGKRALWARAGALQEALRTTEHPGDLNQALMEVGATVCSPRAPLCAECPLEALCQAHAAGDPERYPTKIPRSKPVDVAAVYGLAWVDGWVLGLRPPGLLGGMWEPVGCALEPGEHAEARLRAAFEERAGLATRSMDEAGTVRHVFSHRRLSARVFHVEVEGTPSVGSYYLDVRVVERPETLPLSTLARKLLALGVDRG